MRGYSFFSGWRLSRTGRLLVPLIVGTVLMSAQEPVPIPGGDEIPGFGIIHNFLIGPPNITFEGIPLDGLNVEPNGLTNFQGLVAQAYLTGAAAGNDGHTYDLASDIRIFHGEYVDTQGSHKRGTFVFI